MKTLKGAELEAVRDTLLSAFPNWDKLDELATFALELDLEQEFGRGGALKKTVLDLIKHAQSEGWTELLLRQAALRNPGNPALRTLVARLGLAPAPFSGAGGGYEAKIMARSGSKSAMPWREEMLRNEQRVCQVLFKGQAIGTGFLIGPNRVMSNWHVFEQPQGSGAPGALEDYTLRFDWHASKPDAVADAGRSVACDAAAGYLDASDKQELDYVIVQLAEAVGEQDGPDGKPRGWLKLSDESFEVAKKEPGIILQHPQGRTLELALGPFTGWVAGKENLIYEHAVETDNGSSGSPCFAGDWKLLALHHRMDPDGRPCNRAVAMAAILARMGHRGTLSLLP